MDYEKKYKDALERAKQALKDGTITNTAIAYVQNIFPELISNNDEKMIRIIEDAICTNEAQELVKAKYGLNLTDLADWLEKQGEQKPQGKTVLEAVNEVKVDNQNCVKPTDEEMKELLRTEYEKGRADAIAETQVAWSEEDEKMLNLIIAIFEVNHQYGYFKANELNDSNMKTVYTEEIVDWLKSLEIRITNKQ